MEVSKEYLEKKLAEYKRNSEQAMKDSLACEGAAQAIQLLLADLAQEKEVV